MAVRNKKNMLLSIIGAVLLFTGFLWGGVAENKVFAASINNESSSWGGGSASQNGEMCTINYSGKYRFELCGGNGGNSTNGGGHIIATAQLRKGDVLTFYYLTGGTGACYNISPRNNGGDACIIYLNGTPLVGAGGRAGYYRNARGWRENGWFQSESYNSDSPAVSSVINNSLFSAGGGGHWFEIVSANNNYNYSGGAGQTIAGCTAAGDNQSGSNYLDMTRAVLVSAPNDGSTVYFNVQVMPITKDESYGIMASSLQQIAEKIGSSQTQAPIVSIPTEAPTLTVIKGKAFSMAIGKYDDMLSGSASGITVTNATVGDGYIMVSGTISSAGQKVISINGKTIIFNVVEEPNSANVLISLN